MAEEPSREEQVSLDHVREKFDNWINASGNQGKVYASRGPDLWAFGMAIALVLAAVSLALAIFDGTPGFGWSVWFAGAAILIGVVSIVIRRREV